MKETRTIRVVSFAILYCQRKRKGVRTKEYSHSSKTNEVSGKKSKSMVTYLMSYPTFRRSRRYGRKKGGNREMDREKAHG